jgi:hypothetical protein
MTKTPDRTIWTPPQLVQTAPAGFQWPRYDPTPAARRRRGFSHNRSSDALTVASYGDGQLTRPPHRVGRGLSRVGRVAVRFVFRIGFRFVFRA